MSYGYDALERLSSVTGPAGTTSVEWEAGGQRLLALRDNTLTERHCYDGRGWLTAVVNATSEGECNTLALTSGLHSLFEYAYDGRGNRVSQKYQDGSLTAAEVTSYGYDGADWLTGVKYPNGHAALYRLAGDGTRTGEREVAHFTGELGPDAYEHAVNGTKDWTYGFDPQGGLKSATQPQVQADGSVLPVQVAAWVTDAAGRVTQSVTPEGTRSFAWSARDTLGQATFMPAVAGGEGTPVIIGYGYDADGLRRSRTVHGNSASYLWAAGQLLEERLPNNSILYENAVGMALAANADRLAHDGLGSVVGLVGATQTTRKYDAWGGFVGGTAPSSGEPTLAYAGQAYDRELGLSYAQQRWYDKMTGRFLSVDPIGVTSQRLTGPVGLGWWNYADANSLRFVDPLGLYRDNPQAAECAHQKGEPFAQCMRRVLAIHAREEQQGKINLEQPPLPSIPGLNPYTGPIREGRPSSYADRPTKPQEQALSVFKSGADLFHEEQARRARLERRAAVFVGGVGLSIALPEAAPLLLESGALGSTGLVTLSFGANTASGLATEYGTTGRVTARGAVASVAFGVVPLLNRTLKLKAAQEAADSVQDVRVFYSVQNADDASRLAAGGAPWPTGMSRANLGEGFYAWGSESEAQNYLKYLQTRMGEESQLRVVKYGIELPKLQSLKQLDLTILSDVEQDAFLERFSHYGAAEPHGLDYIQRGTGKGVEHYFSPGAFAHMTEIH